MKLPRRAVTTGLAMFAAGCGNGEQGAQDLSPFVGGWTGVLDTGSARLRVRFQIAADGSATLQSLDQGGHETAARAQALGEGRLRIRVDAIHGVFEGQLAQDQLQGIWRQGAPFPMVLTRGDAGLAQANEPEAPLTQARLSDMRRAGRIPAIIVARSVRGGVPTLIVDGERIAGSGVAATRDDLWHIGSNTKSMTATLVARMVEAGWISWTDTVGAVLGEVAPRMRPEYRDVTYRHLLCHRSGLPSGLGLFDSLEFELINPDPREERKTYARRILSKRPRGPKESTFEYSNGGYTIAGAMLEASCGESWETLLRAHVFEPLGITSGGFGPPGVRDRADQPRGHKAESNGARTPREPGQMRPADNPAVVGPAGIVHLTAADLLKFLDAHRDQPEFLSAQNWQTLHRPPFTGEYAMGWVQRDGGRLWHNGSNTFWYAEMLFDPAAGVSAAVLSNDFAAESQAIVGQLLRTAIAYPFAQGE